MATISTEFFTQALTLTHLHAETVAPTDRMAAEQYLMALRSSPEGLNLAFHIVSNEDFNDIRCFWAFNTIIHHLPEVGPTLAAEQSMLLYQTLWSWLIRHSQHSALPDFVANKHAQTIVVGIQEFYPLRWTTVFEDLFALLGKRETWPHSREQLTVYFLRVFEYIDERVVCVRSQTERTREQRTRDMEVKDAMRELVIQNAVTAWYQILCEYRVRSPEIVRVCLEVLQAYVEWIDITLLVTPDWMNLLYYFTTVPHLRQGGCECLYNMIVKKQLTHIKVETIQATGIVDALPRIVAMVPAPTTDEEEAFLLAVVTVTTGLAEQLLSCAEGNVGNSVQLLHAVVAEVIRLFSVANFQAVNIALGFVQQYVKSALLEEGEAEQLLHLMYRHTVLRPTELASPDDLVDLRKMLHNLIRLLYRKSPAMVLDHCSRVMYQVVVVTGDAPADALPAEEAEGAMRYLYELGEALKMDAVLKDAASPFAQMIFHTMHCDAITGHREPLVHLAYFELIDRYGSFFVHHKEFVGLLLNQFLTQSCGVMNANSRVRSRICYLFAHMVQCLKVQVAPHAEQVVRSMEHVLCHIGLQSSDKLDLYEGLGSILSVSDLSICASVAFGVARHMHSLLAMHNNGDAARDAAAVGVSDDIAFLSHLAKGLAGTEATKIPDSPPLSSKGDPSTSLAPPAGTGSSATFPATAVLPLDSSSGIESQPAQVFWQVTRDVTMALEGWYPYPLVRDRACMFMHQMVNILSHAELSEVLEYFFRNLLQWSSCSELPRLCRVLYQYVNRTRGTSVLTVSRVLPLVYQRVCQLCCDVSMIRSELGVVSEYTREQAEVYRSFLSVIHAVAHCSCITALFVEPTRGTLDIFLELLLAASRVSAEFELPKQALQILSRLVYHQTLEERALPGEVDGSLVVEWALNRAVPEVLDVLTSSRFDHKDAKNYLVVAEFCQLMKYVVSASGEAGLSLVLGHLFRTGVPEGDCCVIGQRLREDQRATMQFKNTFRQALETAQSRRWSGTVSGA